MPLPVCSLNSTETKYQCLRAFNYGAFTVQASAYGKPSNCKCLNLQIWVMRFVAMPPPICQRPHQSKLLDILLQEFPQFVVAME